MAGDFSDESVSRERLRWRSSGIALLTFFLIPIAHAAEACDPVVGRVVDVAGRVEVQHGVDARWVAARLEDALCEGDTVRAAERSRAAITLINQAVLRVDQNTTIRLIDVKGKPEERSLLNLVQGAIQSFSRKPRRFDVSTPYLNGSIEGTEFVFRVADNQAILTVFEGVVRGTNERGTASVTSGQSVAAGAGKEPRPLTVIRPRDAAQWALYYPPVMSAPVANSSLAEAVQAGGRGDTSDAFAALDRVPQANRDAQYALYRASLLLSVGRVEEARADIDTALALDPKAGPALALRAVINVAQNEKAQALSDANQAVALSPDASSPRIALSYAQQANFQIPQARDTLLEAVQRQPDDALAWARLAELWLMLGDRDRAIEAAQKATTLAPDLARTHIAQGFAALAAFRTDAAIATFERAISLNSADPLPYLGLGLARIGGGKLDEGRRDLEVAVALDGSNALLRAYLGKAYFEEKRPVLDGEQFAIAKELDPLDPTAFLYDGIRKQTENQPVSALRDVEDSIERNDNRAAYRGRLLLDKDRAARGTSLARVYSDLGFAQLGVNESAKSLILDPADSSAHRFLSDSYQSVRRREIARVSELLQAQLMQDININPVQPSISEANLNIVTLGGPSSAGFNEFTPLFQRNRTGFNVAAFGGNNGTAGGEAVVSALYDRYSFSVGAFTYETDGWRPNNGLDQDAYDVFAQAAVTDKLNIQAEFRRRESTEGDLAFNFDPNDFLANKTTQREQDTARIGLRYSSTPHSHFLLSLIHSDRDEGLDQVQELPPDPFLSGLPILFTDKSRNNVKGDQIEAQFIRQGEQRSFVIGAAHTDTDRRDDFDVTVADPVFGTLFSDQSTTEEKIKHPRAYAYVNISSTPSATWTLGASYDDYEEGFLEEASFNPKLGVQWDVTGDIRLRAAAFRVLKPALVNNRTLEPTQIAGFNQLYDDRNATKSDRYAGGMDWRLNRALATGAEFTVRKLQDPVLDFFANTWIFEDREEQNHKLYLFWTPTARIAVRTELVYDRYDSDIGILTEFANLPEKVTTVSLPIGATWFSPSGLFAGVGGTFVDQEVQRSVNATQASGSDNFFVADAAIGYRFPRRHGTVSIEVKNLFDDEFNYQDDSYREFRDEPAIGPYFPDRTIMARVVLGF